MAHGALIVAWVLLLAPGDVVPAERIRAATRAVLADPRYQKDLPGRKPPEKLDKSEIAQDFGRPADGERVEVAEEDERRPARPPPPPEPDRPEVARGVGAVIEALFWAGLIVGGAIAAFALVRAIRGWVASRPARGDAEAAAEEAGLELEKPLTDAEALAALGQFAEAIHVLLLRTLAEIERWRKNPFDPSLTSREIQSRAGLGDEAGGALGDLVAAVERSLFGGLAAGRGEYDECIGRFDLLRAACATRSA